MTESRSAALAAVFFFVPLAFGSAHAAGGASAAIYACVRQGDGILRVVAAPEACRANETPIRWNVAGPAGTDGVSAAFVSSQAASAPLTGEYGDVVSVDVPPGSYVIHGKVFISTTDWVVALCRLLDSRGNEIDNAVTAANRQPVGTNEFIFGFETIPLQAALPEWDGGTVSLQCLKGGGAGNGVASYGKLEAIQVDTIN